MNIDLAGRTMLVTGSSGPLASAVASALSDNGGTVRHLSIAEAVTSDDGPFALVFVSCGTGDTGQPSADIADEHAGLERLARRPGCGRVITLFSAAGLVPIRGLAQFSAGQAGLASLTRTLAMELGPDASVNGVAVGAYESQGNVVMPRLVSHAAVKRPASLGEIVAAVLFLADPDNSYMTGHTLAVDGGWSAGYARNF